MFVLGGTLSIAQGLFLTMLSGITPGGLLLVAQETLWGLQDQNLVIIIQGKWPNLCTMVPAVQLSDTNVHTHFKYDGRLTNTDI